MTQGVYEMFALAFTGDTWCGQLSIQEATDSFAVRSPTLTNRRTSCGFIFWHLMILAPSLCWITTHTLRLSPGSSINSGSPDCVLVSIRGLDRVRRLRAKVTIRRVVLAHFHLCEDRMLFFRLFQSFLSLHVLLQLLLLLVEVAKVIDNDRDW